MDLDGFCLMDGVLRCVEFKRKYPAADGTFGLDQGAISLAKWLQEVSGMALHHVILSDPRGIAGREESPLILLNPTFDKKEGIVWLGKEIRDRNPSLGTHTTSGRHSGRTGELRPQDKFPGAEFVVLGSGLRPKRFREFLAANQAAESPNPRLK